MAEELVIEDLRTLALDAVLKPTVITLSLGDGKTSSYCTHAIRGFPTQIVEALKQFDPAAPWIREVEHCLPALIAEGRVLVMAGETGSGKTVAAYYAAALAWVLERRAYTVLRMCEMNRIAIDAPELFQDFVGTHDLLICDDWGKEHHSASGWYANPAFNLIDTRAMNRLPTIITCNMGRQMFLDLYGEPTLSRIEHWGWWSQLPSSKAPSLRRLPPARPLHELYSNKSQSDEPTNRGTEQ